jgi:methylated-DNA-[protein]-cysteine S-methyltransferase
MIHAYTYETKIGKIGIAENGEGITGVYLTNEEMPTDYILGETTLLQNAAKQLYEYLDGKRKVFDLPLTPTGTPFQTKVWHALQMIPYGETRSYKQIAETIGNPKASRAVGMANNKNPIAIFIPCHRVIGSNGTLVGYAGGLKMKEQLLYIEKLI